MIVVTDDIGDIKKELRSADTDTLVAFDCDDVLTTLEDQIWKRENYQFFVKWCANAFSDASMETLHCVSDFILTVGRNCLVNEEMPRIVDDLHAKNIQSMVLTALSQRPVGSITDPLRWRVATLNGFGYNFGKFWPALADKRFDEFACAYQPEYSSGVVCSGETPKGQSLRAFLKHAAISPRKVIFIDDKEDTVEDVKATCESMEIAFVGIQYLEASKVVSAVPFSEEMMEYQLNTLKEKNIWLPDGEAHGRLKAAFAEKRKAADSADGMIGVS
ncbi:MAG: DUF2608 domain-containing protein [Puniceicoccales bacterium]|jgi:hypothetical protein|nr:DUF2608 domain-containing protein [Puniceicoccales bacterium]